MGRELIPSILRIDLQYELINLILDTVVTGISLWSHAMRNFLIHVWSLFKFNPLDEELLCVII